MKLREYFVIQKEGSYVAERLKVFKGFIKSLVVAFLAASIVWFVKDAFFSNGGKAITDGYWPMLLLVRLVPFIPGPFVYVVLDTHNRPYTKRDSALVSILLELMVWVQCVGVVIQTSYLYTHYNYLGSGLGWTSYFITFFIIAIAVGNDWWFYVDLFLISTTIILQEYLGYRAYSTSGGAVRVVVTDLILSLPLGFASLFLKTVFAEEYQMKKSVLNIMKLDQLTDSYNRFIIDDITDQPNSTLRERCTIFIVDVDNFKSINDQFGHVVGDIALVNTVNAIKSVIRSDKDKVIRFGGDEFLVYIESDIDPNEFYSRFLAAKSDFLIEKGITHSIGVAKGVKSELFYRVVDKADKRLYKIKTTTKNGICAI